MKTISIRGRYQAHDTYLRETIAILQQRDAVEFPISFEVFSGLANSIESILYSILNCVDESNIYACSILYRSLIEHFYRGMILVNELANSKSEEASEHYQKFLFVSEFIAEQMGALEAEDVVAGNTIKSDIVKYITDKFPGIAGFDKENQREISAATKKFVFREIIKKLHADFSSIHADKSTADFFTNMLPEYSRFSTFTHGGPYAQHITNKFKSDGLDKELWRLSEISFSALCILKEHLLMCFKMNKEEVLPILNALHNLRLEKAS